MQLNPPPYSRISGCGSLPHLLLTMESEFHADWPASFSVPIERSFDAMRMLTLAAIAAITDTVLRMRLRNSAHAS